MIISALKTGSWLTRERIRLVAFMLLGAYVLCYATLFATAENNIDRQDRPLGTDFSNIYAAGTYVLEKNFTAPFDPALQQQREEELFGKETPFYGWHYPPVFLFLAGLLALLPYKIALLLWQLLTFAPYLLVMAGLARTAKGNDETTLPITLLLSAAFPAVFINFGHGHNGFLSASLMGAFLLWLPTRPVLAGIAIGLLAYKPQFGLLIPIALLAGSYWRAFLAAAATVVTTCTATWLAFGREAWEAFFASTHFSRTVVLEEGNTGWQKIQSVFSWARMWGTSVEAAYLAQGAVLLALAYTIFRLWRSNAPYPLKAAALAIASLLASPYVLDYDLMLLAPAIGLLAMHRMESGFSPWGKTLLAALWISPFLTRMVAEHTFIPLAVILMLVAYADIIKRPSVPR